VSRRPDRVGEVTGDYTGNAWASDRLYAVWTDTRTGLTQDEVGWIPR
jgi:hypothetical protein